MTPQSAPLLHRLVTYLLAGIGLLFGIATWGSLNFSLGYTDVYGVAYALWSGLLTLLVPVALVLRYRWMRRSVWLILAAIVLSFIPAQLISTWWALPIVAYHAGKHFQKHERVAVLILGVLLAFCMGGGFALLMLGESEYNGVDLASLWTLDAGLCVTVTVLTWTWGTSSRLRILRQQELEERAARLEFEREQERSLAAVDERSRIAREMHDIVAHSLSVIVMQADGARYSASANGNLDTATQALEQIGQVSREALAQTRGVLGLLRSSAETELAPLPTLDDLPQLIEIARSSGVEVIFPGVTGTPHRPLAAGVQLAAYRVVQEALTNVRKHATGAPATVTCAYDRAGITVEVVNEAPPVLPQAMPGAGKGLQGMIERVALYHGELIAAPLFTGGFQVKAFFPYSDN